MLVRSLGRPEAQALPFLCRVRVLRAQQSRQEGEEEGEGGLTWRRTTTLAILNSTLDLDCSCLSALWMK